MVVVPAAIPVTEPPEETVATAVLLLLHAPPDVALVKAATAPSQTATDDGTIATGVVLTVTGFVTKQPVPKAYEILATPTETPVTSPPEDTDAAVELLLHVPEGVASDKESVVPIHIVDAPEGVIATGLALTVTVDKE